MIPLTFAPDVDTAWSVAPGTAISMNALAPLQTGAYGSIGTTNFFGSATLTGTDIQSAQMFRLTTDAVILIVARDGNLDKYDSSATRTNVGTGYSSFEWSMANWGDLIIATNATNGVQASTAGGAFSALGGSPPTARSVAANQNFVMLAFCGTTYDQVWWSGIQNPLTWTPDIKTQCGNYRLLDTPGPVTGLSAYRDTFVAFKQNSMYVGTYVGVPYVWSWKLVSNKVGCLTNGAIAECDGKLYFFDRSSGFYEFDGMSLRNIGVGVFQSFLAECGDLAITSNGFAGTNSTTYQLANMSRIQAVVDDLEGIVWWRGSYYQNSNKAGFTFLYGYNTRTGKWGRHYVGTGTVSENGSSPSFTGTSALVRASVADMRTFLGTDTSSRFLMVWNDTGGTTMRSVRYPNVTTDGIASTFTTGTIGNVPGQQYANRIYLRHLPGSSTISTSEVGGTVSGYVDESKNVSVGSTTMTWNVAQHALDFTQNAEFAVPAVVYATGEKVSIGGIDINLQKVGAR